MTNMVCVKMSRPARHVFVGLMVLLTVSTLLFAASPRIARAQATMTVGVYSETYFSVNVTDPTLKPGNTFDMDIQVVNPPPVTNSTFGHENGGISGFNLLVNYNPSILNATNADFKAPLCPSTDNCLFAMNSFGFPEPSQPPGNTTVGAVSLGRIVTTSGILFRIHFKVQKFGYTDITVFPETPSEGFGVVGPVNGPTVYIPYDSANGSFDNRVPAPVLPVVSLFSNAYGSSNVTDASLTPGHLVTFEINVANAPTFNGYEFSLYYDSHFLQFSSSDTRTGTVFANPFTVREDTSTPGTYSLTVVNIPGNNTAASGTLVHVTFNVVGVGVSPVVLAAGTARPSTFAQQNAWTRLVLGSTPIDTTTADGYFKNDPVHLGPVPSFTFAPLSPVSGNPVTFDASASFDPDNSTGRGISRFIWDFGDGFGISTSNTEMTHTFENSLGALFFGNFSVRLTVVDIDNGFEGMVTRPVTIAPPVVHDLGIANMVVQPSVVQAGQNVSIGADVRNFGTLTETYNVTIKYGPPNRVLLTQFDQPIPALVDQQFNVVLISAGLSPGTYLVEATVVCQCQDSNPSNNVASAIFTVVPPVSDIPPVSDFAFNPSTPTVGQLVFFNGLLSHDPDGTIDSYSWNFGDGSSSISTTPNQLNAQVQHPFSTPGNFYVTLTVTDNAGLTGSKTELLLVVPSSDLPPIARFTFSPPTPTVGTAVSFDGSQSFDPDGFVQSWSWNFGDNYVLGSGPNAFHTYSSPGNYTVTLTVTDNAGLTNSSSRVVPVHPPLVHDVGVVFVNVEPRIAVSGQVVDIVVGLTNNGQSNEAVSVTAYYDSHIAASRNGISLPPNNPRAQPPFPNIVLDLSWDTTSVAPGNYTISATIFLATDQNPANDHLSDGNVTILPPPTLTLTPNSGSLGTQVRVNGSGFPAPQYGPSELFISFDDQFLGFAFPRDGAFNFTFNVPHADPNKPHLVKALDLSTGLTTSASFHVLPTPPPPGNLAVVVSAGAIYFPGDTSVIYVQTTLNGSSAGSGVQLHVQLVKPDGSSTTLTWVSVTPRLYKATYAVPKTGSTGTYAIVATASLNGQHTAALATFEVKTPWIASQSGRTTTTGLALAGIVGLVAFASWKGYRGRKKEDPLPF